MNIKFITISFSLFLFSIAAYSQQNVVQTKIFFNKNWAVCKPEKAYYYRICGWDTLENFYEGEYTDYQANGTKLFHGNYLNGAKNGPFTAYYETGSEMMKTFFKDDKPDSIWILYYPDKIVHFVLNFNEDQFEIREINNITGNSILNTTCDFIYEFQNDTLNKNMQIIGMVENKAKEGKWKIIYNKITLGYDLYRKNEYIETVFESGNPTANNEKLINNSLFIPYSVYACENLFLDQSIEEKDYPILSFLFPWEPIETAYGIIGDSILFKIDQKPEYLGGLAGLNETINNGVFSIIQNLEKSKKFGIVYYEITINENGVVTDKRILKSPDNNLSEMTLHSLSYLKDFKPAINNKIPIKSRFTSYVKFEKPTIINALQNDDTGAATLKMHAQTNYPHSKDTTNFKNIKIMPKISVGINGGYSYRTIKTNNTSSAIINNYANDLKTGYCFGADLYYFPAKITGFGFRSSVFKSKSKTDDLAFVNSRGQIVYGYMEDDISICQIGASVVTRFFSANTLNSFLMGLTLGYDLYKDEVVLINLYKITGKAPGLALDFGFDRKIGNNLIFNTSVSLLSSRLFIYKIQSGSLTKTYDIENGKFESLTRFEIKVGLKIYK